VNFCDSAGGGLPPYIACIPVKNKIKNCLYSTLAHAVMGLQLYYLARGKVYADFEFN
jgi:hypothetical protein